MLFQGRATDIIHHRGAHRPFLAVLPLPRPRHSPCLCWARFLHTLSSVNSCGFVVKGNYFYSSKKRPDSWADAADLREPCGHSLEWRHHAAGLSTVPGIPIRRGSQHKCDSWFAMLVWLFLSTFFNCFFVKFFHFARLQIKDRKETYCRMKRICCRNVRHDDSYSRADWLYYFHRTFSLFPIHIYNSYWIVGSRPMQLFGTGRTKRFCDIIYDSYKCLSHATCTFCTCCTCFTFCPGYKIPQDVW